jgi:hypothetical protein
LIASSPLFWGILLSLDRLGLFCFSPTRCEYIIHLWGRRILKRSRCCDTEAIPLAYKTAVECGITLNNVLQLKLQYEESVSRRLSGWRIPSRRKRMSVSAQRCFRIFESARDVEQLGVMERYILITLQESSVRDETIFNRLSKRWRPTNKWRPRRMPASPVPVRVCREVAAMTVSLNVTTQQCHRPSGLTVPGGQNL